MPITPQDKPIQTLREETIDALIMNYGHGHLSLEAFERRLDAAFAATNHDALLELTADLDLDVDSGYIEEKKRELGLDRRGEPRETDYVVNIFSGGERSGAWIVPEQLRVLTIFGGTDIDFSDAKLTAARTHVSILCLFGGIDLFVPEGVRMVVKTFAIFGGVSNKAPTCEEPSAPTIVVEGLVLFGGVDVKIKRTLKERLLQFANSLRSMFGQSAQ